MTKRLKLISRSILDFMLSAILFFVFGVIAVILAIISDNESYTYNLWYFVIPFLYLISAVFFAFSISYIPLHRKLKMNNKRILSLDFVLTKVKMRKVPTTRFSYRVSVIYLFDRNKRFIYVPSYNVHPAECKKLFAQLINKSLNIKFNESTLLIFQVDNNLLFKQEEYN